MSQTHADCAFCVIGRGVYDAGLEVICEGDAWVAFFPLEPATAGHTLVIARQHYANLWEVDARTAAELMVAVQRVGTAIISALSAEGMNLITSAGRAAEQTVNHVHLHLVPRWADDGFGRIWPLESTVSDRQERDAADRVRAECARVKLL